MIPFIFFVSILAIIFVVASFILKSYPIAMISALGMMVIGVNYLSVGAVDIVSMLTVTIGIVYLTIGLYVMLGGAIQKIQEDI